MLENTKGKYIIQQATGTGKTVEMGAIINRLNKWPILVIAHRAELLEQIKSTCIRTGIDEKDIQIVLQNQLEPNKKLYIASIQTLYRRDLSKISPNIGIIDEAHHALEDNTYGRVMQHYNNIPWLGFTATPTRRTKKEKIAFAETWDDIIYSYPIKQGIKEGYLAKIMYYTINTGISLDSVKMSRGDFDDTSLAAATNVFTRNKAMVDKYNELNLHKTITFCVNKDHCHTVAKTFQDAGIESYAILEDTPKRDRKEILQKFQESPTLTKMVLTSRDVLGEGCDFPSLQAIFLARKTMSTTIYIQQFGRGLRNHPDLEYKIIVDMVDQDKKRRKVCNCLNTVFQLADTIHIEGDIIKQLDDAKEKIEKPPGVKDDPETFEQENVSLQIANILFELPEGLEESNLAWFAPEPGSYFCQVEKDKYFRIEDKQLRCKLFDNKELVMETANMDEIVKYCEEKVTQYKETSYMWKKSVKEFMEKKEVTPGQRGLLAKIAPGINPDLITSAKASEIISAHIAKKNQEPITKNQRYFLMKKRYNANSLSVMSKRQASKEIAKIINEEKQR